MKKFTLLLGAFCAVMTAGAAELTQEGVLDLRLTADELMQVEGSKRIAIRCTQRLGNQNTYYDGTEARKSLPLTDAMVFDWESDGEGMYYIKKSFVDENAYLQNYSTLAYGSKDSGTVAKFTAKIATGTIENSLTNDDEPNATDFYVRLHLNDGNSHFHFNSSSLNSYITGTGCWTVQNIIDLSSYYRLIIKQVKDGVTTTTTHFLQEGDEITVPEYDGYDSDYVATVKTADDNQEITVNYTPWIELVENATVATKIVDGAIIAMQCLDTNGGLYWYFNGDQPKSEEFQLSNLFVVVGTEGGFYLKQKTSGKYVGGSTGANALVQLVDAQSSANVFTAAVASPTGWTTKPDSIQAGVNTIRFTTGSTFLNTNDRVSVPKYFTGTGGYSAWYVYTYSSEYVDQLFNSQVDVTFTFPAYDGQTLTMTVKGKTNSDASQFIPSVPFFNASGLEGENTTISAENTAFTVAGNWTFPFALETAYRADMRQSAQSNCTNFYYNSSNGKVETRNGTDAAAFVAERLFYVNSTGFSADGQLKVTLHSIAADEAQGFQVSADNNALGAFSATPTEFLVVTNSNGTAGVSLRHPGNASSHVNDVNGTLGVWQDGQSQNDGGSYLRFKALEDSDFESLMSTAFAEFITQEMLDAAKASKSADDVRALFSAAPYLAVVAEAEALLQSIDGYTAEHFGEELGYLYGTDYETIMTFVGTLQAVLTDTDAGAITAATEALAAEVAKVQVHLPEAGKYYRFKGVEGGWYITPSAATGQMAMTAEPSANSAFRFNEVEGENNVFVPFNVVYQAGITGTYGLGGSETYTFYPSQSKVIGAFTVKSNATEGAGQWVYNHYDNTDGAVVNRNSVFHQRCNWYLEEVNEDGTGIEEINVESGKVQGIYDLQGRRLSAPVKGINIINGKKVLVK